MMPASQKQANHPGQEGCCRNCLLRSRTVLLRVSRSVMNLIKFWMFLIESESVLFPASPISAFQFRMMLIQTV